MKRDRPPAILRHDPSALSKTEGYSQVVEATADRMIFLSGQVALDSDGVLVGGGDLALQARQAFRNIGYALATVGCTASHLVKLTVYLRDMRDLAAYRAERDVFFGSVVPRAAPAITLIAVDSLYRADLLIEIDAIAARP